MASRLSGQGNGRSSADLKPEGRLAIGFSQVRLRRIAEAQSAGQRD